MTHYQHHRGHAAGAARESENAGASAGALDPFSRAGCSKASVYGRAVRRFSSEWHITVRALMKYRFGKGGTPPGQSVRTAIAGLVGVVCFAQLASAADLHPKTVAAFDRYVAATEAQRRSRAPFLWIDGDTPAQRSQRDRVRGGELLIEALETRDAGRPIDIPDGLVHHWLGAVFVPGATVEQAIALLQDYDRHADIYKPNVARSRLLARDGDTFRVYLRFVMTRMSVTAVVNSDHTARFTRISPRLAESRIAGTRIAEVDNAGTAQEREKPVGQDSGYLWRLNSYWRFQERDGGVYVQCESISLSRGIPFGFSWLIRPFVTGIPRDTLAFTLETTRKALATGTQRP